MFKEGVGKKVPGKQGASVEVSSMGSHKAGGLVWRETDMDPAGEGQSRQEVTLEIPQQTTIGVNSFYYMDYIPYTIS